MFNDWFVTQRRGVPADEETERIKTLEIQLESVDGASWQKMFHVTHTTMEHNSLYR